LCDYVSQDKFTQLVADDMILLERFLRQYFPENVTNIQEVCERGYDEIIEISRLDFPDYGDKLKYANSWWCFAEVSSDPEFDRPIFFAEAQNIGYKRTKRNEQPRPNDLYDADTEGFPVANIDQPNTIFDYYCAWRKQRFF
jgi:type I restriction enzyme M protein